tara:strand:+ start:663 stop:1868 length:1206 start_codon:yes stop_codon:yes gene_type:complete
MANTFTSNYSLVKSEIGGDNQNWGQNLHNSLDAVDSQLVNKFDKDNVKGFTSTAIIFTNTGSSLGTISAASGDLFEDFEIGDKVRVTGAASDTNGSTSSPSIHTISNKSNSNSITVSTGLVTASAGDSVTITLVFEPGYVDGAAIDNTPIGANTESTGKFSTLEATGNVTLGNANTDTVTSNAKHGATTFTGQVTSEVTTGTAPFSVASTTKVTNLNADTLDGQTAPSGTIVGTSDTQELTNKTLNSSTNTIHADQWRTSRTLTLSGDCTGSATIDGSGNVSLTTTVGGLVKFKGTGKVSGTPASGKTWIAYGHATYTNENAGEYTSLSDLGELAWTGSNAQVNIPINNDSTGLNTAFNRYGTAGYGYGDVVSINTGSGYYDYVPSGATATWTYTLEFDDA